jgi:hypothetical protein
MKSLKKPDSFWFTALRGLNIKFLSNTIRNSSISFVPTRIVYTDAANRPSDSLALMFKLLGILQNPLIIFV